MYSFTERLLGRFHNFLWFQGLFQPRTLPLIVVSPFLATKSAIWCHARYHQKYRIQFWVSLEKISRFGTKILKWNVRTCVCLGWLILTWRFGFCLACWSRDFSIFKSEINAEFLRGSILEEIKVRFSSFWERSFFMNR